MPARIVTCSQQDRLRLLRGALKNCGDALVRVLASPRDGTAACWLLRSTGEPLRDEDVQIVMRRPFRGGRLVPSGDHLPGMEACGSQTWRWQATVPATPPCRGRKRDACSPSPAAPGSAA